MSAATGASRDGKIITFYSYKGGAGRSMALANVAWLLANQGLSVLAIDWDLEAPGLHRYFEPFLADKSLERSTGVIDFFVDIALAAVSAEGEPRAATWYEPYSNLLAHALSLKWDYPEGGTLDFVPAGRQDAGYATKVTSFNWQQFYEQVGGGTILQAVRKSLKQVYDVILIDSRTGVSDTSGICTVQMPDEVVVCFTLNRQSICGAAAVARSVMAQRTIDGRATITIWPVPMRVESFERERLELAQTLARAQFAPILLQLDPLQTDVFWGEIGVPYEPYYAYEELLAPFRDRPNQTSSLLARMETIAGYVCGLTPPLNVMDEEARNRGLSAFLNKSAVDNLEELTLLAAEYERIRKIMREGNPRTRQMTALVARAQTLAGQTDVGDVAETIFARGTDGSRVIGLALARKEPQRRHFTMSFEGIKNSRSAFEQYHALLLALRLVKAAEPATAQELREAIEEQMGATITSSDSGRWNIANELLSVIGQAPSSWDRALEGVSETLQRESAKMIECAPSASYVLYEDVPERHGPFVNTRGTHHLELPRAFRISRHLITNRLYRQFIEAGGYQDRKYWTSSPRTVSRFLTADGLSNGPASWPHAKAWPKSKADHPVSGICYLEAQAFVAWCNSLPRSDEWTWCLPTEDIWEFAARGNSGLTYPWGDIFNPARCNSIESGLQTTCDVTVFEFGASKLGCCDMAGNVWEFVDASDARSERCVMRGGSYKNNEFEVRSYLRLSEVPANHRASDFGFRVAQRLQASNISATRSRE
jgi:formylglycine-generating enzyme required for sulfatase activity/cellulose biosynthesis protein BcsQ